MKSSPQAWWAVHIKISTKKISLDMPNYTGCPTKHDSWWIVLNVFFHILYWFCFMEEDILNYLPTVMFRGTLCTSQIDIQICISIVIMHNLFVLFYVLCGNSLPHWRKVWKIVIRISDSFKVWFYRWFTNKSLWSVEFAWNWSSLRLRSSKAEISIKNVFHSSARLGCFLFFCAYF